MIRQGGGSVCIKPAAARAFLSVPRVETELNWTKLADVSGHLIPDCYSFNALFNFAKQNDCRFYVPFKSAFVGIAFPLDL